MELIDKSKEIGKDLKNARIFTFKYNKTNPKNEKKQQKLLKQNLGDFGENSFVMPPFSCDRAKKIHIGSNVFINYNAVLLDCDDIFIGNNVRIAPNCSIYTVFHPTSSKKRRNNIDYTKPVWIGDDTWIGGNVTILPGVKIGSGCIIGAGSVVSKDIPSNSLAYGTPAKVMKDLTQINNEE